ncbi:MAG TPA: FAD-binding oxidoreductase [Gemmatimonadaceae bacterium]|nr:FAD-binding oxidoreductase [Gemmatimonadaceae bacterium]
MEPTTSTSTLKGNGQLRADVLGPGDEGYDEARRVFNGMIDRRPSTIIRCRGAADVIHAVNYARERDLLLAVRGGGHSFAGKSVCDGGLMIDLSLMRAVRVSPDGGTVHVQGGATWADVDHETQAFGLATTGGLISHTGVAGLTLGGGVGWLARKHGLACDNLLSADVVTAAGQFVHASEGENPDLFWGLRGGSGNFGVVTSFEFQVHPVGPEVLGGFIIHPFEAAAEGLRFYRDFTADARDEVACYAIFGRIPKEPPFPEKHQGRTGLFFAACYAGPVSEAAEALAPLRAFGDPILDALQPMPYKVLQKAFDEAQKPGNRWYGKSGFWEEITDDAIDTLVRGVDPLSGPLTMVFFECMGGAIGRIPPGATAFPHREAPYNFGITAGWTDPADDEKNMAWTRELHATLSSYDKGIYVNYADEDESERTGAAYGRNYDQLVKVKNAWDPNNLFRMNMNIVPAV